MNRKYNLEKNQKTTFQKEKNKDPSLKRHILFITEIQHEKNQIK